MKSISIVLIVISISSCYYRKSTKTGFEGKLVPEFKLLMIDSVTYFNSKDIPSGKPFVLLYYNPHCPYCRAQMKNVVQDMNTLKDINIYLVTNYTISEMKGFFKEYHLEKYTNIIAGRDLSLVLAKHFKVSGVPYIAIYGKDKKFKESFVGQTYCSQIKKIAFE